MLQSALLQDEDDHSMSPVTIQVQRVASRGVPLPLPMYATPGAAGMDLLADVEQPVELPPQGRALIPTGLAIAIPPGWEAQVRPRSGLALKSGVTVANAPGTIDSDYRGEVAVILINLGAQSFMVKRGDRIAQLVIAPVVTATMVEVTELSATQRGAGGFGSTGS
jgi:dUTP pyrophosphatase